MADDTLNGGPDVAGIVRARMAIDPAYVDRLFQIESGGNPNAVTGSNRGLSQMGPSEEARYGISDANRADPRVQASAVLREAQEHSNVLRKALGRDPSQGELYLAHQQGIAGGPALLKADPSAPAWQVVRPYYQTYEGKKFNGVPRSADWWAQKAITGNVLADHPLHGRSPDEITAGDFRKMWVSKFERSPSGGAPTTVPAAPAQAPLGFAPSFQDAAPAGVSGPLIDALQAAATSAHEDHGAAPVAPLPQMRPLELPPLKSIIPAPENMTRAMQLMQAMK